MRLLVIEDNRELADLMKEKLSGFGYVCDVAYDGENGDLKISDNDYDAVLPFPESSGSTWRISRKS